MSTALLHYGSHERKAQMLAKLGGREVLQKATDAFYDKQLHDDRLMKFFRGTDMAILKWHQFNLMSIAFTAVPEEFDVYHLIIDRHKKLFDDGLTEVEFDIVMGHFESTLTEMKLLDESVIEEALSVVRPLRKVFVVGAQMARDRRAAERARQQRRLWTAVVTVAALVVLAVSRAARRVKK
jgi:hemoglobin